MVENKTRIYLILLKVVGVWLEGEVSEELNSKDKLRVENWNHPKLEITTIKSQY